MYKKQRNVSELYQPFLFMSSFFIYFSQKGLGNIGNREKT